MPQSGSQRQLLWDTLPHECHYCHRPLTYPASTRDHIVPRVFGGTNHIWNQVLACGDCNNGKTDRVGVCQCERCESALKRFRMIRTSDQRRLREHGGRRARRSRSVEEVERRLAMKVSDLRSRLDVEHDPLIAASIRGSAHGIQIALDLIRTVGEPPAPVPDQNPLKQFPFTDLAGKLGVDPTELAAQP